MKDSTVSNRHIISSQSFVSDGTLLTMNTIRAISVCELNDLNKLPLIFNQSHNQMSAKNLGWFSCTGGQVKLSIRINRLAFVCGENISIIGRYTSL